VVIKVLIVDDHAVVRQGLKQIITGVPDMTVVGEATDGVEALEKAQTEECDVLVLDISLPGRSGLDILKDVRLARPKLPVLVLSMHAEEQFAVRLLRAGASGYLNKESAPDELVKAIYKVVEGGKYVSPALAERLAFEIEGEADKLPHETLSDREFQVMCLLATGKTVKEIAEALSLSAKTVSTYRTRILTKMNLKTNADLIHYAIQNGLAN
jgi:two-component system, NarL family, invasion response regulator UvrY